MDKIKRIGAYVRVSTLDQNLELQESEIKRYLEARGLSGSVEFYRDKASGTNGNRQAFKTLMGDCRARKIDLVISWKLDRMYRGLKDLLFTLQEFEDLGVEYISLRDNLDLSTAAGRMMMQIIGCFAEFEASLIKSRVIAGLENAKRKGVILGRPVTVNRLAVFRLRKAGLSLSQIAKELKVSKTAVHKTLSKKTS